MAFLHVLAELAYTIACLLNLRPTSTCPVSEERCRDEHHNKYFHKFGILTLKVKSRKLSLFALY